MEEIIYLLTFLPSSACEELKSSLVKLGYKVMCRSGDDWLQQSSRHTCPTVAYIEPETFDPAWLNLMTGRVDPANFLAVLARKSGRIQDSILDFATEIVIWPYETEELGLRLRRLRRMRRYSHTQRKTVSDQGLEAFRRLNLIGDSPAFITLLKHIEQVSDFDITVLLQGETGTGKELVARALHYLGNRQDAPFIPVNCGALPQELLESELFGHERGAFTDAKQRQSGLVELADGGTLFMDEIDSLSARAQVTVLRFLQEKEYRPIGGNSIKTADVRLVAASNKDLKQCVEDGTFREDLYYRLCLFPIELPPLRHRSSDDILLAEHFLEQYSTKYERGSLFFGTDALQWLRQQEWPGNVRELENTIHRACLIAKGSVIHCRDYKIPNGQMDEEDEEEYILSESTPINSFLLEKQKAVEQFEKKYLQSVLKKTKGNISEAARLANKERRSLGKLLKKHGIDRHSFQ